LERKPLRFDINITVSGGSGSNTTSANSAIADAGGYLRQLIVKAPHDSATFNFRIANSNGHNILVRTEQVGEIVDDLQTPMPAGTYTCYVSGASHNGTYEVELIYAEVY
jgi:hypothetical protein